MTTPPSPQPSQDAPWKPARWWRFRSWHPAVAAHRQLWWYADRLHFCLYLCCGDLEGGSDHHLQTVYIRWWPTRGGVRNDVIPRGFRVHPMNFLLALRSWWFDSEGFRGVFGPWELVPERGGPDK